jgi:hypothetical protein
MLQDILNQRKELFQKEREHIKKRYIAISKQIENLDPASPMYTKLLAMKEKLTVQLYSKDMEQENKISALEKRINEVESERGYQFSSEEEKKKWWESRYSPVKNIKEALLDIRDNSPIYKLLETSAKLGIGATKLSLKGVSGVAKLGLNALLTKKVGGRKKFGITFGGRRVGRYKFNNNLLKKYSSDYKKLYEDFYMLGKGFYNKKIKKKGEIGASDVIAYMSEQGKTTEEIREQIEILMQQGMQVSQSIQDALFVKNDNIKGSPFSEDSEFSDYYDNVSNQDNAIMLDDLNKKTLQDTLFDFYEYIDRKNKKEKKKGSGIWGVAKSIFGLIKKLGIALVGIATFLGPTGIIAVVALAVGLYAAFWNDAKKWFFEKVDSIFGTSFSSDLDKEDQFSKTGSEYGDYVLGVNDVTYDKGQSKKFDVSSDASLGQLSEKYEGRASAGTVSSGVGDKGGVSFGKYQFASKTGGLASFMDELKESNPEYYEKLTADGGEFYRNKNANSQFQENWKKLAKEDPNFAKVQDEIAKKKWFDPTAKKFQDITGVDPNSSKALANAIWSAGIQHGGVDKIFKMSGIEEGQSQEEMIRRLYGARADYVSGLNIGNKRGIFNRYTAEEQDAYAMLDQERIAKMDGLEAEVAVASNDVSPVSMDIIEEEERNYEASKKKDQSSQPKDGRGHTTDKVPAPIQLASHLGGGGLDLLNTGVRI